MVQETLTSAYRHQYCFEDCQSFMGERLLMGQKCVVPRRPSIGAPSTRRFDSLNHLRRWAPHTPQAASQSEASPRSLSHLSFILRQSYSNSLHHNSSPHVPLHILADPLLFPCPPLPPSPFPPASCLPRSETKSESEVINYANGSGSIMQKYYYDDSRPCRRRGTCRGGDTGTQASMLVEAVEMVVVKAAVVAVWGVYHYLLYN